MSEAGLTVGSDHRSNLPFPIAAISITGGSLQMYLGQPDTSPRLDNAHRFMGGVYLGVGFICVWAGITVRQQGALVYLLALGVLLAGRGHLDSIAKVGLPKPTGGWLGYLVGNDHAEPRRRARRERHGLTRGA